MRVFAIPWGCIANSKQTLHTFRASSSSKVRARPDPRARSLTNRTRRETRHASISRRATANLASSVHWRTYSLMGDGSMGVVVVVVVVGVASGSHASWRRPRLRVRLAGHLSLP